MKAIQCPNCHKYTPGDRSECLACGSPLSAEKQELSQNTSPNQTTKSDHISTPNKSHASLYCPKCGSTYLTTNKKGFSFGKAVVGTLLIPGVGLLGGFIGSQKVKITCLQCGYEWVAGTPYKS